MTLTRQRLGRDAEALVANQLAAAGWRIVARNARTRHGEIDIIGVDGRDLVFVEVKARRSGSVGGPELPELAVGVTKRRRLRRLAAAWLAERPPLPRFDDLRFDVVAVTLDGGNGVERYEHIRDAF
jgi:putative endonuclease